MFLFSCVCVCNIWIDVKPFLFSFFPSAGGPSMYCELVQRSGHSTCGYHGWSPWRTCCLCCSGGKGLSREPQQQNFGFTRLSQSEIFFGVVFNLWAWYFFSHGQGLSREPYSDYFQLLGLFLEALLVAIVFSEHLPLFDFSSLTIVFQSNLHVRGFSSWRINYRSILV